MKQIDTDATRKAIADLLNAIGLPPAGDLEQTPDRVSHFYEEFFASLHESAPALQLYPVTKAHLETIALREIPFYSLCSHHLLPFYGSVSVAYRPAKDFVLGFSGIVRIVRYHAERPTLQETLATAISDDIRMRLGEETAVYVEVSSRQLCTEMRGIRTPNLEIISTSRNGGDDAWYQHAQTLLKTSEPSQPK